MDRILFSNIGNSPLCIGGDNIPFDGNNKFNDCSKRGRLLYDDRHFYVAFFIKMSARFYKQNDLQ